MNKRTKNILFYSAVAVFLILSYVIILYAQGYKYSFSDNRFFKTGAIYLKVNTDANIILNDESRGSTSFFGNSHRIEGLIPGQYTIKVQRDDYSSWQKLITVDEGFVSEFSKILILPKDEEKLEELDEEIALIFSAALQPPTASVSESFTIKRGLLLTNNADSASSPQEEPEQIAENVRSFIVSKDNNKIAWWTANEVWVMWLNDANYQPYHEEGDRELITRFSTQIKKAAWFRDEDHLIIDSSPSNSSGQVGYKILEIDTRGGINIIEI